MFGDTEQTKDSHFAAFDALPVSRDQRNQVFTHSETKEDLCKDTLITAALITTITTRTNMN